MEEWNGGRVGRAEGDKRMDFETRKNINRGYRKLIVWQDAVALYSLTWEVFKAFPYVLQRVASQQVASVDSVHRNIAEGYCRRSLKEYLQYLNIALASAGESVSSLHAYRQAGQLSAEDFERLDTAAWKLENGLTRLIESLQRKKEAGGWQESFVEERQARYSSDGEEPWWHSIGTDAGTETGTEMEGGKGG
jgi:four helix bundle protein